MSPEEFVRDLMEEVQEENRKRMVPIIKRYPNDFIDDVNIIVHVPTPDKYKNMLDKVCVRALKELCPNAEIEVRHVNGLSWGIEDIELTRSDNEQENSRLRQGVPTDLELLRKFYNEVAEEFWPDIVAERRRIAGE